MSLQVVPNGYRSSVARKWIAIAFVLMSGGCLQSNESRSCFVFDHPALEDWRSESDGETLVFTSPGGESLIYTVEPLVRNEPYTAVRDSVDGPPGCLLSAEHVLQADDGSHVIKLLYLQGDLAGRPTADDSLSVTVSVELPGDPGAVPTALGLSLTDPGSRADRLTAQFGRSFSENRTLADGVDYIDVFELEQGSESALLTNPDASPLGLARFALARGVGLVEIERLSGVPFTRVP